MNSEELEQELIDAQAEKELLKAEVYVIKETIEELKQIIDGLENRLEKISKWLNE